MKRSTRLGDRRTDLARRFSSWLSVCLAGFLCCSLTYAQGVTATVTGIVMDSSQAVVPGAAVLLIDEGSRDARRTVTNGEGYFTFSAVQARTYRVRVELSGFQAWDRVGIELHPEVTKSTSITSCCKPALKPKP